MRLVTHGAGQAKNRRPSPTPIGGLDFLDMWTAVEKIQKQRFGLFRHYLLPLTDDGSCGLNFLALRPSLYYGATGRQSSCA